MPTNNSRGRRLVRREEAIARNTAFAALSTAEKITMLTERGFGGCAQVARLSLGEGSKVIARAASGRGKAKATKAK